MGKIATLFSEQKITLPITQKQQMLALDRQFEELEAKVKTLEAENLQLRAQIGPLKKEVERLKQEPQGHTSNPQGYVCDHCASLKLKRTGSRPAKHFGEMGIKDAIFTCLDCGKESVFMQNPK